MIADAYPSSDDVTISREEHNINLLKPLLMEEISNLESIIDINPKQMDEEQEQELYKVLHVSKQNKLELIDNYLYRRRRNPYPKDENSSGEFRWEVVSYHSDSNTTGAYGSYYLTQGVVFLDHQQERAKFKPKFKRGMKEYIQRKANTIENVKREAELANAAGLKTKPPTELPDGKCMVIMEHIDGMNGDELLDGICLGNIPYSFHEFCEFARKLLNAVAAMHRNGIVHHDLKPANIMIDTSGNVRIIDFGLGKWAGENSQGCAPGTVFYSSKEQIKKKNTDNRCDLVAVGRILSQFLLGDYYQKFYNRAGELIKQYRDEGRANYNREACTAVKNELREKIKNNDWEEQLFTLPCHVDNRDTVEIYYQELCGLHEDLRANLKECLNQLMAAKRDVRFQSAEQALQAFEDLLPSPNDDREENYHRKRRCNIL